MVRSGIVLWLLVAVTPFADAQLCDDDRVITARGDATNDGVVNITDATCIVNYLFQGGPAPPCLNQADANNDGSVDNSDATYVLNWLYSGGPAPPAPGPYNTLCTCDDEPYPGCAQPCR